MNSWLTFGVNLLKDYWWVILSALVVHYTVSIVVVPRRFRHVPYLPFYKLWYWIFNGSSSLQRGISTYPELCGDEDYFLTRMYGSWYLTIRSTEASRRVLSKTNVFRKVEFTRKNSLFRKIVGESVNVANGAKWRNQHSIVSRPFKYYYNINLLQDTLRTLLQQLGKSPDNSQFTVQDWIHRYATDSMGKEFLETDLQFLIREDHPIVKDYKELIAAMENPFNTIFPWITDLTFLPWVQRALRATDNFEAHILKIIEKCKNTYKEAKLDPNHPYHFHQKGLLELMIAANDAEKDALTDTQVRDNLIFMLLAGYAPSAVGLTATLYMLAKHPSVQTKLRNAIEEIMPTGAPYDAVPSLEELQERLPYVQAVIKESYRLIPPVVSMIRNVTEDNTLVATDGPGGKPVYAKKGDRISVNIVMIHRNPKYWDHPNEFIPERFMDPKERKDVKFKLEKEIDPAAFMPFGAGSRRCLARDYSLLSASAFICVMVRNYEFILPEDSRHKDELKYQALNFSNYTDLKLIFRKTKVNRDANVLAETKVPQTFSADKENFVHEPKKGLEPALGPKLVSKLC